MALPEHAPSLTELKARARRLPFFIIDMMPTSRWKEAAETTRTEALREHLLWQQELERSGVLLLAGPVDADVTEGYVEEADCHGH